MIAITFALPAESSGLVRRVESNRIAFIEEIKVVHGQLQHRDVAIFHTGVGQKNCERSINAFLQSVRPEFLISSGFAGSLSERLQVGDLIIGENFSEPALAKQLLEDGAWATPAQPKVSSESGSQELAPPSNQLRVRAVRLITVQSMVDSTEERARLAHQHGADAIDMETDMIAQACAKHGIPMLSLRIISDSPAAPFPAPAEVLFDLTRQQTDFGRLIPYVITHPSAIPRLCRFARQIGHARGILTDSLVKIISNTQLG